MCIGIGLKIEVLKNFTIVFVIVNFIRLNE